MSPLLILALSTYLTLELHRMTMGTYFEVDDNDMRLYFLPIPSPGFSKGRKYML